MSRPALLLAVLLPALVAASGPNVATLKTFDASAVNLNKDLQVTFTLFNLGDEDAYDVSVTDNNWPESFEKVFGVTEFSFGKLAANTNVSHTFVVKPTLAGVYSIPGARVLYKESEGAATTVRSMSNPVGYVRVADGGSSDSREVNNAGWFLFVLLSAGAVLMPFTVMKNTREANPDGLGIKA